jgi:hypothetical protein
VNLRKSLSRLACAFITGAVLTSCVMVLSPYHRPGKGSSSLTVITYQTGASNNTSAPQASMVPAGVTPTVPGLVSAAPYTASPSLVSTGLASPLPPPTPLVIDPDTHATLCPPYTQPVHPRVPPIPDFTQEEQKNADQLNVKLVQYIGSLRVFISHNYQLDTEAYTQYQTTCLNRTKN